MIRRTLSTVGLFAAAVGFLLAMPPTTTANPLVLVVVAIACLVAGAWHCVHLIDDLDRAYRDRRFRRACRAPWPDPPAHVRVVPSPIYDWATDAELADAHRVITRNLDHVLEAAS